MALNTISEANISFFDPDQLADALLAMHAVGLWQASDDLAEEFAAEDLPELEGAIYYRRALEAYQQKGVINAAEMQSILDAVPMAGSIAEDAQLRQRVYDKTFTMVREANQTIIENVSANFRHQIKKGGTIADFVHDINDVYDAVGIDNQQKWYSELVYRNNMRRVRQEGLDAAAKRSGELGTLWGYRWVHSGSDNPRPAHLALNGFEAPKDDPRWDSIGIPPIGHNCGCQRVPVSNYRARKKGLSDAPETPMITEGDYAGTDAIKGLNEIPGERFGPSRYDIDARPLINPSWGVTI